jgi:hypothetical protein
MKHTYLFFILCFSIISTAQNYDFGKVSKEELEEAYNPLDSSAHATYLYKNRNTYFQYTQGQGFEIITEVHERIKIYSQEGFKYATKRVGLYVSSSNEEDFSDLKAYSYNLNNGKILKEKLNKSQVFEVDRSKYYKEQKFTMPNIKVGSVIEYKYAIVSPFIYNVVDYQFQFDIPVKKVEAKFSAPEYFVFKVNTKGFLNIKPVNKTETDAIVFTSKSRSTGNVSATSFRTSQLKYDKYVTTYNLSDVPALIKEPYVNNINNYRAVVDYELSYTKMPDLELKYYSTTWEDVVKMTFESPNFGGQLDKTGYFQRDIDPLISNISDPIEKTKAIFNFVKFRMKWNNYYSKYTSKGVKKAYIEKTGNVAEINLMLTAMLRYAGLNSDPILVSTRHNGIPLFPTREGYNYVIARVRIGDEVILLDATDKYSFFNILPLRALNWEGRVIRKNGTSGLIDLYPKQKSVKAVTLVVILDESGSLEGSMRTSNTNHKAMAYRRTYQKKNKDKFINKKEERYDDMEILNLDVVNASVFAKPVIETFDFNLANQADVIGGTIYISPLFFLRSKKSPFQLENREFPIDFGYPSRNNYRISITIPQGYKVESLPKPVSFALPDNLGTFRYNISANSTTIQLAVISQINEAVLLPNYYSAIKAYFNQMIVKENEQVVLKKI